MGRSGPYQRVEGIEEMVSVIPAQEIAWFETALDCLQNDFPVKNRACRIRRAIFAVRPAGKNHQVAGRLAELCWWRELCPQMLYQFVKRCQDKLLTSSASAALALSDQLDDWFSPGYQAVRSVPAAHFKRHLGVVPPHRLGRSF